MAPGLCTDGSLRSKPPRSPASSVIPDGRWRYAARLGNPERSNGSDPRLTQHRSSALVGAGGYCRTDAVNGLSTRISPTTADDGRRGCAGSLSEQDERCQHRERPNSAPSNTASSRPVPPAGGLGESHADGSETCHWSTRASRTTTRRLGRPVKFSDAAYRTPADEHQPVAQATALLEGVSIVRECGEETRRPDTRSASIRGLGATIDGRFRSSAHPAGRRPGR